jgi:RHS repeat-associated protein
MNDARNRVTSCADGEGNTLGYRYDAADNLTNLIYPGSQIVTNFYDSHNRLTNVTDWAGRETVFHYDLAGRVRKIIRPNLTTREIIYDDAGQTREIWERKSDGTPITVFKIKWDDGGRVEHEFIAPLPKPYTEPSITATYDADNRLNLWNSSLVLHDADGNLVWGPQATGSSGFSFYEWNPRNQLTVYDFLHTYGYDSEGHRVRLTVSNQTNRYAINPHAALSQVLVRTKGTADGTTQTLYVHGLGLLYEVDPASGQARYHHYDYRGSTVAITDEAQNVTDRVEYSPYGATTHRTGTTETPFLFNGRYGVMTDPNGLLFMRARYCSVRLKRFLNPDPIGFSGGMNFYAAFDGNPVSYLDPHGLQILIPELLYERTRTVSDSPVTPIQINNPVGGLLHFMFGEGQPAVFGPRLIQSFQSIQSTTPFQITARPVNRRAYDDWALFDHPIDVLRVGFTVGQFRYINDGRMTATVGNEYGFPLMNTEWETGERSYQNALLSPLNLFGKSYQFNGSWVTPQRTLLPDIFSMPNPFSADANIASPKSKE